MNNEQLKEVLINFEKYTWDDVNYQNFINHLKTVNLNELDHKLKNKALDILSQDEEKQRNPATKKYTFEEIQTILGKWERLKWEEVPKENFLNQLVHIDVKTLSADTRELAKRLIVAQQGKELAQKRKEVEKKDKNKKTDKTGNINGALILILLFGLGAGVYFGWPYATEFIKDTFEKIDKFIDPNKDDDTPYEKPIKEEEETPGVSDPNENLSASELLNKLVVPNNYKLTYTGNIAIQRDMVLERISLTMETQKNEIPQFYTIMNMYNNSDTAITTTSYGYLENGELAIYYNVGGVKQWYKTTTNYYDANTNFASYLVSYGTSERGKNTNTSAGLMNVVKVSIPFQYFKSLMLQDSTSSYMTFDYEKNVVITLQINAQNFNLYKYEINYNECALSYNNFPVSSYSEIIQYFNVGKIETINLPTSVLSNLLVIP